MVRLSGDRVGETLNHLIGQTPLVEIHGFDSPLPLLGKCEHLNPAGSVKDRLALALIESGERSGRLRPGGTIVEATAGNTGLGLAMVAKAKGYSLICILPEKMSVDKRQALRAAGAEVIVTANAPLDSPENFRQVADRLALERGWFLADQFRNPANVECHYRGTGPEIARQLTCAPGAFVAGIGTGGTLSGVGRYLKEQYPACQIVLADPAGSSLADWINLGRYGPDGPYAVEGIGSSRATEILDRNVIDFAVTISDADSFSTARRLQRECDLPVGGSSGTAVAAALQVAQSKRVEGPIVVLLADSVDRYLSQPWMQ